MSTQSAPKSSWLFIFFIIIAIILSAMLQPVPVLAASGKLLRNSTGLYPRAIRLAYSGSFNGRIIASVVAFSGNNGIGAIYESADGGSNFTQVGTVSDPQAAGGLGLCCATLYELPQQVGSNPAGTLLWAASTGQSAANRRMALRIWKSADHGRTWSYLSSCAVATTTGGLWEPEFSIATDGALVCHYADETDSAHSQKLARARSYDGLTWQNRTDTVSSSLQSDRPGMPIVRKLPNGTYLMVYEICTTGGQYRCAIYYRTSTDGWNWGAVTSFGTQPTTSDGRYFTHAPNLAYAAGKLFLVGQMLNNANGTLAAGNGQTIFVNTQNGTGAWSTIAAPVTVPGAYDNYCPNYSSALLPSTDGTSIFELATDYNGTVCEPYFASGPAGGAVITATPTRTPTPIVGASPTRTNTPSGPTPTRTPTPGAAGVIFYQDANYGGAASGPKAKGDYAVMPGDVINDWMSSLRVPAGWIVDAYADGGFAGAVCTYTADTSWVGPACNDVMSSFRIR